MDAAPDVDARGGRIGDVQLQKYFDRLRSAFSPNGR